MTHGETDFMLTNTRLDAFGQSLLLFSLFALMRAVWLDRKLTAFARQTYPDTYSRDPRKWALVRKRLRLDDTWHIYAEANAWIAIVLIIFSCIALQSGSNSKENTTFAFIAFFGSGLIAVGLLRDAFHRRR